MSDAWLDAATHTYVIKGERVGRSATTLVDACFPFDAPAVIDACYGRWKRSAKYGAIIAAARSELEGKQRIAELWKQKGAVAAAKGTAVHAFAEDYMNVKRKWGSPSVKWPLAFLPEAEQIVDFVRTLETRGLPPACGPAAPYWAELIVWWEHASTNRAVVAGTIDALFRSTADRNKFTLVDWKTTHKAIEHGTLDKFSLQTSLYAEMLLQTHGIDVEDRMFIVRVRDDLDAYDCVKCTNVRAKARALLLGVKPC